MTTERGPGSSYRGLVDTMGPVGKGGISGGW